MVETKELMTGWQQLELQHKLDAIFREHCAKHGLAPRSIFYFMCAYLWGYARSRLNYTSRDIFDYLRIAFSANERRISNDTLGTSLHAAERAKNTG